MLPHLIPFTNKALRSAPQSHRTIVDKASVAGPDETSTASIFDGADVIPKEAMKYERIRHRDARGVLTLTDQWLPSLSIAPLFAARCFERQDRDGRNLS